MSRRDIERVQTGVRMEKRILLVLKAMAGRARFCRLAILLEGIVLHASRARRRFTGASLTRIATLKEAFGLDLTAADSHLLVEQAPKSPPKRKGK
jgi:hypothetical protein